MRLLLILVCERSLMCQSSPGPRCSRHAQQQLERSQRRLATLRSDYGKITASIDEAVNDTSSYLSDEEVDTLRAKQQEIQEQIEDQVDRVSTDRDAYWTTPRGREDLKSQIASHREANNLRAVHTLTARLERAEEEYEHRVLAGKIARQEKDHLEATDSSENYHKYVASTQMQRKALYAEEAAATHEAERWKNRLKVTSGNASEMQHAFKQSQLAASRLKESQIARRRFEEADYARRAGISSFAREKNLNAQALSDGKHYLRLRSTDFGAARDHFPTGALVKITSSHKDDVGNTVVELETGDERLIYADAVVVRATA